MQSLQGYFNGPQWDFVHVGLEKASKALRFKNKEKKQTTSTKGKKMSKSNKKTKNSTVKSDMVNASVAAAAAVVDISSSPAPQ